MKSRTRKLVAIAAVASAPLALPATITSAQDAGCAGDAVVASWPNSGFGAGAAATIVVGNSWYPTSLTTPASVPAGEYSVQLGSYDGYTDRALTPAQTHEQYVLQFLDAGGAVITQTGPTSDLADGGPDDFASRVDAVGTVVLDRPATQVRAVHAHLGNAAIIGLGNAQSVQPTCFGLTQIVPTTTTTSTTTTSTTTTTTTTTSTTTTVPDTTTTVPDTTTTVVVTVPPTTAPPTTAPPTTTTEAPTTTTTEVPTQVLPTVEVAQPAEPVQSTPSFTG